MKIAVCVKRVPDPSEARIDPETRTVVREGVKSITNPFDLHAVEEAVRLKEEHGGAITVFSMGPTENEESLREAVAMGADEPVLITDSLLRGSDTLVTSLVLASAIRKSGPFDMVLCGREAIDGDTGQVGPGIAENLGIPHVTYVRRIQEISDGAVTVERMVEDGYEVVQSSVPALLTVVKDINDPRIPSLRGMMRARKVTVTRVGVSELGIEPGSVGLEGSPTQVVHQFSPEIARKGEMLDGEPTEQARSLVQIWKEIGLL